MVLYLAGLKSVDPTLREAAAIDGANQRQTFFRVVFPVMRPINVVIIVITVIESLRAFDIAYIINRGKNGLELLSILITNNSISEASLIGFGSAIAVVLLVISLGADHRLPDPHDAGGRGMTRRGDTRATDGDQADRRRIRLAAGRAPCLPHRRWPWCGCSRSRGPCSRRSGRTATRRSMATCRRRET